jgi:hypothetical protein
MVILNFSGVQIQKLKIEFVSWLELYPGLIKKMRKMVKLIDVKSNEQTTE